MAESRGSRGLGKAGRRAGPSQRLPAPQSPRRGCRDEGLFHAKRRQLRLPKAAPFEHGAAVNSVSVSADGQRVVTAADDGMARLWDLRSGRLLVALTHPVKVSG